ncbi:MAG: hypothetical protein AABX04_02840 [Nanoarchaeota archaeon]
MIELENLTYDKLNVYLLFFISLIIPGASLLLLLNQEFFLKLDFFKIILISVILTLPIFTLFYLKLYQIIPKEVFSKDNEGVKRILIEIPAFLMLICFVLTIILSLISWAVLLIRGFTHNSTIRFGIIYGFIFYCLSLVFLIVLKYEWFLPRKHKN